MKKDICSQLKLDEETYKKVYNSSEKRMGFAFCEECGKILSNSFRDSSGKIVNRFQYSHILSKGAFPEYRHNTLNFNILCQDHHQQWETGDRKSMKIYEKNQKVIEILKNNG
jgi:hypothetical protein